MTEVLSPPSGTTALAAEAMLPEQPTLPEPGEAKRFADDELLQDAHDRLLRPEAERSGTEIVDQFTGETRRPCVDVELEGEAKQRLEAAVAHRSEGYHLLSEVLDRVPIKEGKLAIEPLPWLESVDAYAEKAYEVFTSWAQKKAEADAKRQKLIESSDPTDVFGFSASVPRDERPAVELEQPKAKEPLSLWVEGEDSRTVTESLLRMTEEVVQEHAQLKQLLERNRQLVADGVWPGEKTLEAIERAAFRGEDEAKRLIYSHLRETLGQEDSALAHNVAQYDKSYVGAAAGHLFGNSQALLYSLGQAVVKNREEGVSRGGTVVDLYTNEADMARAEALAHRLETMFDTPQHYFSHLNEIESLRSSALARRMVDFCAQVLPEDLLLFHATNGANIEGLLSSGELGAHKMAVGVKYSQGQHSNYVHFGEPGKYASNYAGMHGILVGLPLTEVLEVTPYHQAETGYGAMRHLPTQEFVGEISFSSENVPLALGQRLRELQQRIDQGLVDVRTNGDENNMSFAASSDRATAARYSYSLDKSVLVCTEDEYPSLAALLRDTGRDEAWINSHVTVRPPASRDILRGYARFEGVPISHSADAAKAGPNGRIKLFGMVAQYMVTFGERDLESLL